MFWTEPERATALVVGAQGAAWQHGELDAARHPQLAEAWRRGAAPDAPLIGRDPGVQLRALRVLPPAQPGGAWRLDARALAPYPVRLTLLAEQDGLLTPVGSTESALWNRRSHFARVSAEARLPENALVALRIEGAYQASESLLRLRRAP